MSSNLSKTARTVIFRETGGPQVLKVENVEIPAPGPQEVRIRVKAIGINRADVMYRNGLYMEQPVFPAGIGYEAAGIIESVGAEVVDWKEGDVVNVMPAFSLNQYSTYGELILVPAYTLQKYPGSLSYEEAASLWTSYISMYGILVKDAEIKNGDSVLITAASSSAGLAAIQLVNFLGGISIAITSSASKRDIIVQAGAQHVIVSAAQDLVTEVNRITSGKGANIVLDPVGGPMFEKLIAATAERAKVFVYGAMSNEPTLLPMFDVLSKLPVIKGYSAVEIMSDPAALQAGIRLIIDGVNQGKLKPLVARSFPITQVVEAHMAIEANQHIGKIVLSI
jgi:NADPH:quinone reductase-like Zn-dependent oxidoreductase